MDDCSVSVAFGEARPSQLDEHETDLEYDTSYTKGEDMLLL